MNKMYRTFLFVVLSVMSFFSLVSAQENMTITTYYPSPHGVYNQMQVNRQAMGDTNGDGSLDVGDQPPADGQLYTARSVIYKPHNSLPGSDLVKGELVYNNADDSLWLYNGTAWVKQSGGGNRGCYVSYTSTCATGFVNTANLGQWGSCFFAAGAQTVWMPPGSSAAAVAAGHPLGCWNNAYIYSGMSNAYLCCGS